MGAEPSPFSPEKKRSHYLAETRLGRLSSYQPLLWGEGIHTSIVVLGVWCSHFFTIWSGPFIQTKWFCVKTTSSHLPSLVTSYHKNPAQTLSLLFLSLSLSELQNNPPPSSPFRHHPSIIAPNLKPHPHHSATIFHHPAIISPNWLW